jgi:hypothetical protein
MRNREVLPNVSLSPDRIEELCRMPSVSPEPIRKFLSTVGNNKDIDTALINYKFSAKLYHWNYETKIAIEIGIQEYFKK